MPSVDNSTRPTWVLQSNSRVGSHTAGIRWQSITAPDAPISRDTANCHGSSPGQAGSMVKTQHGTEKNRAASSATVQRISTVDSEFKYLRPKMLRESSPTGEAERFREVLRCIGCGMRGRFRSRDRDCEMQPRPPVNASACGSRGSVSNRDGHGSEVIVTPDTGDGLEAIATLREATYRQARRYCLSD